MAENLTGRGGPGRGQGRKPNQLPSKRVVIHADDPEYREIIENTTPRMRTEVLIDEARKHNKSLEANSKAAPIEADESAKQKSN